MMCCVWSMACSLWRLLLFDSSSRSLCLWSNDDVVGRDEDETDDEKEEGTENGDEDTDENGENEEDDDEGIDTEDDDEGIETEDNDERIDTEELDAGAMSRASLFRAIGVAKG